MDKSKRVSQGAVQYPPDRLRVLGCGLPRTGTASMKAALEILLGSPCYHMYEVFKDSNRSKQWQDVYKHVLEDREIPRQALDDIFKGYPAAVDAPASEIWEQTFKQYPDLKLILTKRPANDWMKSMEGTIMRLMTDPVYPWLIRFVPTSHEQYVLADKYLRVWWTRQYGPPVDPTYMDQRINEVRAKVPAEQLLEYELGSGWEPLCKFLELPVPEGVPFPFVNDKESFGKFIEGKVRQGILTWAGIFGAAAIAVGVAVKYLRV